MLRFAPREVLHNMLQMWQAGSVKTEPTKHNPLIRCFYDTEEHLPSLQECWYPSKQGLSGIFTGTETELKGERDEGEFRGSGTVQELRSLVRGGGGGGGGGGWGGAKGGGGKRNRTGS